MALHRDIYWVGRQWAVTGYGIQACNQKQRSAFDIEASRLWEDGVLDRLRAEAWVNTQDFDQALKVARKHFSEPSPKAASAEQSVSEELKQTKLQEIHADIPAEIPPAAPKLPAQKFEMHVQGWPARFVRPWRIRVRR
jgi:hypothetical protein